MQIDMRQSNPVSAKLVPFSVTRVNTMRSHERIIHIYDQTIIKTYFSDSTVKENVIWTQKKSNFLALYT